MNTVVALLDFGGPRSAAQLQPFLAELLTDVLPGPLWLRRIAGPLIASRRAPIVQPQYEAIGWSPLVDTHMKQAEGLRQRIELPVVSGMMFTPPTMDDCVAALLEHRPDNVIALSMFPHYSLATTHAAFSFFHDALQRAGRADLPVRWIGAWFDHPGYLDALAQTIRQGIAETPGEGRLDLIFSPHGVPVSFVKKGDPYPDQVRTTIRRVMQLVDFDGPHHTGWQSRVGPARWLSPSTPEVMQRVAADGGRRVCLVPVAFVSEHVETLFEIDVEYREEAKHLGIEHFGRAPALGLDAAFLDTLATLVDEAHASLDRQHCVRCLRPRTVAEPLRKRCPNCRFVAPDALSRPTPTVAP